MTLYELKLQFGKLITTITFSIVFIRYLVFMYVLTMFVLTAKYISLMLQPVASTKENQTSLVFVRVLYSGVLGDHDVGPGRVPRPPPKRQTGYSYVQKQRKCSEKNVIIFFSHMFPICICIKYQLLVFIYEYRVCMSVY